MKKGFMIVIISTALMMFSACTRQIQGIISGQIGKTGRDTCYFLINAYADMFSYVADGRYLIVYRDNDVNQKCIYDLDTLEDGVFSEYVIRYRNSFLFTDNMKEIYLAEAMEDESFEDKPYYIYYDEEGNAKLEIYLNKNGVGCGICYDSYDYERSGEMKGFVFRECHETSWEQENPVQWYEPEEYFRDVENCKTGEYGDEVRNYEERYEYNDDGQITGFFAKGETNLFTDEWIPVDIASYTCEYNEDTGKKKEELFRHPLLFGTFISTVECHYDEMGRIAHIRSYITHGSMEYFFIYEDDGAVPAYEVMVDHNLNLDDGSLFRYVR